MKTLHITLEWNEARKQWDMRIGGHFLQEFFDCGTFVNVFEGLDKQKINHYTLEVKNGYHS